MPDDSLEFADKENLLATKLNRKADFIGTGLQIINITTTYAGMSAYCTSTGSGFTVDKMYIRNAANDGWNQVGYYETAEQSTTAITDSGEASMTGTRFYFHFTLPTTEPYYIFTGITWKNGSLVSGNITAGIDIINANPPTLDSSLLAALGQEVVQTGINATQRVSILSSRIIRGGTTCGAWVEGSGGGSARIRSITGGGNNTVKTKSYNANPDYGDNNAFGGSNQYYVQAHFRGYDKLV